MLRIVTYDHHGDRNQELRRAHDREIQTHLSSFMKFSSAKFGVVPLTI